jgi:Methionine synthase I (cobalamin-dependent), methyltransferase domain
MVQPNAGLPTLSIGNETKYDVTKEEFADTLCGFIDLGGKSDRWMLWNKSRIYRGIV